MNETQQKIEIRELYNLLFRKKQICRTRRDIRKTKKRKKNVCEWKINSRNNYARQENNVRGKTVKTRKIPKRKKTFLSIILEFIAK